MSGCRSVLLLVAAAFPSASAVSVCQSGWTQAPASSDWGNKCYREFGPTAGSRDPYKAETVTGGYTPAQCTAACKSESATGRMLCLASEAETSFVTKQAYMDGWVAYTQDTSAPDYAEPAGGWGWECGSSYVPTWGLDGSGSGPDQEPNDMANFDLNVSCAFLMSDGTISDQSCLEGDGIQVFWSRSALLSWL